MSEVKITKLDSIKITKEDLIMARYIILGILPENSKVDSSKDSKTKGK